MKEFTNYVNCTDRRRGQQHGGSSEQQASQLRGAQLARLVLNLQQSLLKYCLESADLVDWNACWSVLFEAASS